MLVLDGIAQATPFLDVTTLVSYDGSERGLFSIAFAPDYATSGLFYVYYTRNPDGAIQIDEFQRDANDPNIADPNTRRSVLTIPHPSQANHNGGQLEFGPDDLLYIGTGDGGGGGDPVPCSDEPAGPARQAAPDRPAPGGRAALHRAVEQPLRRRVRRPARDLVVRAPEPVAFLVRPRRPANLSIGDVGQNAYEEIDYRPVDTGWGRGVNFGWSCFEGRHVYRTGDPYCNPPDPGIVPPVLEYSHAARNACSITGGYVVRDQEVQSLLGRYVYSDYCNGTSTRTCSRSPTCRATR